NSLSLWYRPTGDLTPDDIERDFTQYTLRILGIDPSGEELDRLSPCPSTRRACSTSSPTGNSAPRTTAARCPGMRRLGAAVPQSRSPAVPLARWPARLWSPRRGM